MTEDEIRAKLAELAASAALPRDPNDPVQMDYHSEYLVSNLWARIKRRVLKRDQKLCQSCGGRGIIVHHRSYAAEVLRGEADEMLATVCEPCHNNIHFKPDGTKRGEAEWDAVFIAGQHQRDFPEPKIDLRRARPIPPPEWQTMTALQRGLWRQRVQALTLEKRAAKGDRDSAALLEQLRAQGRA